MIDPSEIQKKILHLPFEAQKEVIDFIEFLEEKKRKENIYSKPTLNWFGGLKEMRDEYTSVELQHKINEWRI